MGIVPKSNPQQESKASLYSWKSIQQVPCLPNEERPLSYLYSALQYLQFARERLKEVEFSKGLLHAIIVHRMYVLEYYPARGTMMIKTTGPPNQFGCQCTLRLAFNNKYTGVLVNHIRKSERRERPGCPPTYHSFYLVPIKLFRLSLGQILLRSTASSAS